MPDTLCLNLLCPLAVEERVLDALLATAGIDIFASTPAFAHGFEHGALSPEEQVSGRSGSGLVQVLVEAGRLDALLDELQPELARTGVRFWVTPVIRRGDFK